MIAKPFVVIMLVSFILVSCAAPTPISTPTFTATFLPSATTTITPTHTFTPTSLVPTAPEGTEEGMVTYKNAEGNEVTVELGKYPYTNDKGEVIEILQSSDRLALIKYLADQSKWYPADTDHLEVQYSMADNETFHELLAQYDISYPPQNRKTYTSAYPEEAGSPFMPVFVTGWENGTLVVGQRDDKSYFFLFYPDGDPDEFRNPAVLDSQTVDYQYLLELAATNQ